MIDPIHPGEVLKEEFMVPLALSANKLAGLLDVPTNRITHIINGTRGVSADTALRLSEAFQTTPEFWTNLQDHYDLELAKRVPRAKILPIALKAPELARV